jgi:RNA polymerase sigma factor (sigma-70 family)
MNAEDFSQENISHIHGNKSAGPLVLPMMDALHEPARNGPTRQQFEEVFLPHLDAVYNLARWLLRNDQDAEDCVQEAYLRAYKAFPRFRGGDGKAWLMTIVRNVCYTAIKKLRRHEAPESFDEEIHAPAPDGMKTDEFKKRADAETLRVGLEKLPPEFREVLVLHDPDRHGDVATVAGARSAARGDYRRVRERRRAMTCEEIARLIDPYLDGELDAASCLKVEEHLAGCAACHDKLEARQALTTLVAGEAPHFTASPFLATRIRAALREAEPAAEKAPWWRGFSFGWLYSGVGAAAIAVALTLLLLPPGAFSQLAQEGISDHVRSLQVNHLMDVASTDQHTVKPWFAGKLDFSPQVIDLAPAGFPLIGGRLDVLGGRTVAAIVYQRRKHYINLFVWPSDQAALGRRSYERDGYHAIGWTKNGMNYLAVSELGASELKDFSGLIQNGIVPPLE